MKKFFKISKCKLIKTTIIITHCKFYTYNDFKLAIFCTSIYQSLSGMPLYACPNRDKMILKNS